VAKVSISIPDGLLQEVRERVKSGNLSAYFTDSLRQRLLAERQRKYIDEWEGRFGALTDAELAEADDWLDE
jgi:metal-responsive CopG/Arc/MetJ family transcriptional regulator